LWYSNGHDHFFNLNPGDTRHPTSYVWEKQIDDLYDQGAATVDEKKRKAIYSKFQQIVTDEEPMIFLPVFLYVTAIRNGIGNMRPSAYSALGSSWNSWELYKQ
jgi:peptide/nickel transport system substrate-binding protein